jgi:DNA invertase Pin-like site-specific DNA recombinase
VTKRAVLYVRINNDDGPGLAEQLRLCRECAQECGWLVVAELADRGVSGLSDQAPQLAQALTMAGAGEFDVLVAREPSRISRDLTRLFAITEEIKQADAQVRFAGNRSGDEEG